jgi:hypothetical protein
MGQAKRRRQQLGALYGTPKGIHHPLVVYQNFDQVAMDQKALKFIRSAMAKGEPVILIGTEAARPLATAAGLPWLHELPDGNPLPQSLAWDPVIAEAGGPLLPPGHGSGGTLVMGAGSSQWLGRALS